jgi:DNA-binding transcriptional regulator YiaG
MSRANQAPTEQLQQRPKEASEPVLMDQRQRIGPAIRQLRQQQKLSLSDLAQRTGISVSYLFPWRRGEVFPPSPYLVGLRSS